MFAKLILLLSLESKVRRAEKTGKPIKAKEGGKVVYYDFQTAKRINEDYRALAQRLASARTQAEDRPTTVKLLGAAASNARFMVRNAVDNTVGYPVAKWQNRQTGKYLKHHPNTDKYVVDLVPGLFQNIGSQHRYARVLRDRGHLPYHIHPNNGKPEHERVERMVQQYDSLEKKTGAKPHRIISGHSDGAALAIKMVQGYEGRERAMKYKIDAVQARAPSVHGTYKMKTFGQKLLIPLAPNDNVRASLAARKGAVENERAKPYANVHVVAGEYDALATPADAIYRPQQGQGRVKHYLMQGKHSTHFRTAGGDQAANAPMANHIDDLVKSARAGLQREAGSWQYQLKNHHYKKAA